MYRLSLRNFTAIEDAQKCIENRSCVFENAAYAQSVFNKIKERTTLTVCKYRTETLRSMHGPTVEVTQIIIKEDSKSTE